MLPISPDSAWLAIIGYNSSVEIWDVTTGSRRPFVELRLWTEATALRNVVIAPDGSWRVVLRIAAAPQIWDTATGRPRYESLTLDGLQTLVIAPDSSWLATTSYDTTVRIWHAASGELRHTLTGHRKQVEAILIAPDSSWLVTASGDTTVRIWTAKGFGHGLPVVENRVPVNDMAVSPGRELARYRQFRSGAGTDLGRRNGSATLSTRLPERIYAGSSDRARRHLAGGCLR